MTGKRFALLMVVILLVALVFAAGGWFMRGFVGSHAPTMGFRGSMPHEFNSYYPHTGMRGDLYVLWQALAALGAVTGTTALILSLSQGSKESPGERGPAG
jgi:hypothetical protein